MLKNSFKKYLFCFTQTVSLILNEASGVVNLKKRLSVAKTGHVDFLRNFILDIYMFSTLLDILPQFLITNAGSFLAKRQTTEKTLKI